MASAALAVLALFVTSVSVGMGSWGLAALGVALLAAGVALYTVSALNSRVFNWVRGSGHVISRSEPPDGAPTGRCVMQMIVHAPGVPEVKVSVREPDVPVAIWPDPGRDIPIEVALGNPGKVRVRWDLARGHGYAPAPLAEEDVEPAQVVGGEPLPEEPTEEIATTVPPPRRRPRPYPEPATTPGSAPTAVAVPTQPASPDEQIAGLTRVADALVLTTAGGTERPAATEAAAPAETAEAAVPTETAEAAAPSALPVEQVRLLDQPAGEPAETVPEAITRAYAQWVPAQRGGPAARGSSPSMVVADLRRSLAFYRDIVGLAEIDHTDRSAILGAGNDGVVLRQADPIDTAEPRRTHLMLEVADLDGAYQDLLDRGVVFEHGPRRIGAIERRAVWAATFLDPDLHRVTLTTLRPLD
ncbi:MAG TPA: VOC family protein [Micromonosporaceae bacterium]